jgi:hypothetical protein
MRRTAVVCFAVIVVGRLAAADPTPISNEHACKLLKRAAVELCLSRTNLEGRNLLGWYAFRKSDDKLLEWDMAEDRRGAPVKAGCPFESE